MWVKPVISIICVLAQCGCNGPSPAFRGVPSQTVRVGPSVFEVRQIGSTVELLRTNAQYAPTFASIIPQASRAVFLATGCNPVASSWKGEQTLMQVDLDCPRTSAVSLNQSR